MSAPAAPKKRAPPSHTVTGPLRWLDARLRPHVLLFAVLPLVLGVFLFLWTGTHKRFQALDAARGAATRNDRIVLPAPDAAGVAVATRAIAQLVARDGGYGFADCGEACVGTRLAFGQRLFELAPMACTGERCRALENPGPGEGRWVFRHAGQTFECTGDEPHARRIIVPHAPVALALQCRRGRLEFALDDAPDDGLDWRVRLPGEPTCGRRQLAGTNVPDATDPLAIDLCGPRGVVSSLAWQRVGLPGRGTRHELAWPTADLDDALDEGGAVALRAPSYELLDPRSVPDVHLPARYVARDFRDALRTILSAGLLRVVPPDETSNGRIEIVNPHLPGARYDRAAVAAFDRVVLESDRLRAWVRQTNEQLRAGRFDAVLGGVFEFEPAVLLECTDEAAASPGGCSQVWHYRASRVPAALRGFRWSALERDVARDADAPRVLPALTSAPAGARGESSARPLFELSAADDAPFPPTYLHGAAVTRLALSPTPPAGAQWVRVRDWDGVGALAVEGTAAAMGLVGATGGEESTVRVQSHGRGLRVWHCAGAIRACPLGDAVSAVEVRRGAVTQIAGTGTRVVSSDAGAVVLPPDRSDVALRSGDVIQLSDAIRVRYAARGDEIAVGGAVSSSGVSGRSYPLGPAAASLLGFGRTLPRTDRRLVRLAQARSARSLALTLDADLQRRVYARLAAALHTLRGTEEVSRRRAAWAVVLDYRTGAVLAAADAPSFEPSSEGVEALTARVSERFFERWRARTPGALPRRQRIDRDAIAALMGSERDEDEGDSASEGEAALAAVFAHPRDRLFEDFFPPGSTFKPLVALLRASASERPHPHPHDTETLTCAAATGEPRGSLLVGPSTNAIDCLGLHGPIALRAAIQRSCNLYFARAALASVRPEALSAVRIPEGSVALSGASEAWFYRGLLEALLLDPLPQRSAPETDRCDPVLGAIADRQVRARGVLTTGFELAERVPFATGTVDLDITGSRSCEVSLRTIGTQGFGQRLRLNPLFLASVYTRFAHAALGTATPPWVLPRIVADDAAGAPALGPALLAEPSSVREILRGLDAVVGPGGTATLPGFNDIQTQTGWTVYGKTGTAQVGQGGRRWVNKAFISFLAPRESGATVAPAGGPTYLVAVYVERVRSDVSDRARREEDTVAQRISIGIYRDLLELYPATPAAPPRPRAAPRRR